MNESQRDIGIKLALISAALIITILSVGMVGINALGTLNENVNDIVYISANKVQLGEKIQHDLLKITRAEKNIITAQTEEEMDEYADFIETTHRSLIQRLDSVETLVDQKNKSTIVKFRKKMTEYMAVDSKVREYARLNSNTRAREMSATLARKAFDNAEVALRNIVTVDDQLAEVYKKQAAIAQLKVVYGTQIQNNMLLILRAERNIILSTDVEEMSQYADRIETLQDDLFTNQTSSRKMASGKDTFSLDKFARTWDRWSAVYSRVLKLTLLNSNIRALNLSTGDARQSFETLETILIKIGKRYEDRFQKAIAGAGTGAGASKLAHAGQVIQSSVRLLRNVIEYQRAEKNLILSPTQADKDIYMQVMLDLEVDIERRFDRLQTQLETGNENMNSFHSSKLAYKKYRAHNTQVRILSRENGNRRAFDLATGEGRQLADKAELQLDTIVKGNVALNTESVKQLALANDRILVVSRIIQDMFAIHRAEKSLILEKTQDGMDVFAQSIEGFKVDLQQKLIRFKALASVDELKAMEAFEKSWEIFLTVNEQVRVLSRQNGNQFAFDLASSKGRVLADQAEELISDLVTDNELSMLGDRDLSAQVYDQNIFLIIITLTVSTVLGGGFSFFMIRLNRRSVEENDRSQWVKTGQAEIASVMSGVKTLNGLSNVIITAMAKYLGASVGVIYLSNDDDAYIQTGSYAYPDRKQAFKTIHAGQGAVGQAILEGNTIMVSELPDDYIAINSGLGEAVPRHLMVVPLKLDGSVIGALEMGTFEPFSDLQVEFAELVSAAIAIAVNAGENQESVNRLLQNSQAQSEELMSQQEELRSSNEELFEKTKSLEKQRSEIEVSNVLLKKAQIELKEKARDLELSSTYKSQFLANMSHELRTPLNSMLLLSKGLMSNRHGNLQNKQVEDAKIIYEGGQDLLNLINDIMDLSKVEAGKLTINDESVELESLSVGLQRLFNPVAASKNLKFEVDISDTAPESFNTDGQRLEQILKNFLSNAFKFTETGKIILRISPHSASTTSGLNILKDEDLLVFSVIDTGGGIPTDKQQLVFNAFQQLDGGASRNHGGTGLGLAISRELTQLLGGEILVESKEGEGSSFSLYLPFNVSGGSEPKQIKPAGQQPTSFSRSRLPDSAIEVRPTLYITDDRNQIDEGDQVILIIEDDPGFAHALLKKVRSNGYKCLAAADGRSGLYLATEFSLCGILLDIGLPDIDGLEVIKQLKYQARTASVPIYVISGQDRKDEVMASGAIDYLKKPASSEEIEAILRNISQLSVENKRHILVVEDDQNNQRAIASLFRGSAIEFTFAGNGKDACNHITSEQFDCVILDLNLPDMSGFDILERVTRDSKNVLPPIIIYSGRELTDDENKWLAGLTCSVIVKGAESPERLIDEVALFLHSDMLGGQSNEKQEVGMLHNDAILFRDRTILLVDDDMRNVYILSRELQHLGLKVLMAENGQGALDKLNENPRIELVLMDIMMPVMDGYEAMRSIRGISKFSELPIIALTAKAMPEDRTLCIEAGASEYLTKPIDVEKLKSMLRVWLFERTEFNG